MKDLDSTENQSSRLLLRLLTALHALVRMTQKLVLLGKESFGEGVEKVAENREKGPPGQRTRNQPLSTWFPVSPVFLKPPLT